MSGTKDISCIMVTCKYHSPYTVFDMGRHVANAIYYPLDTLDWR